MKKRMITSFIGLLSTLVTLNSSYAQTIAMLPPNTSNQTMKLTYNSNTPDSTNNAGALPYNEVSSKAIRSFEKLFKHTTNQQWYGVERNNYLATFIDQEGRECRVLFAKNGYMIYAISYGYEQNLPQSLRRQIKSMYVDCSIGRVSEVHSDGQKVWVINLEDAETVVIARITEDGSVDELERYQKRLITKKLKRQ